LSYCQISNNNIYKLFRNIYINTGSFKFDVDENYNGDLKDDSMSLIEILNHDSLHILKNENRHLTWYETFVNML